MWGRHAWRASRARAYNGVWGWPLAGSRADPWSGGQGAKPPWSWKPFSFCCPTEAAFFLHSRSSKPWPLPPSTLSFRVKTRRICINLRNDLWQKWGGHVHCPVHPVATPLVRGEKTDSISWRNFFGTFSKARFFDIFVGIFGCCLNMAQNTRRKIITQLSG